MNHVIQESIFSLVNLATNMGQPPIKQYEVEFNRIGKLNPCTITEKVRIVLPEMSLRGLRMCFKS